MTKEEYEVYTRKYRSIQDLHVDVDLESVIELQDATMRAFSAEAGHERIWEEQTRARMARQMLLSKLPRHSG